MQQGVELRLAIFKQVPLVGQSWIMQQSQIYDKITEAIILLSLQYFLYSR